MKTRGFTLIEIMVVVSIIIMLAATLVAAGMYAHKVVMVKSTEGIIAKLSLAISDYASDYNNEYPFSHRTVACPAPDDCVTGKGPGIRALASYIFKNPGLSSMILKGKPESYAHASDFRKDQLVQTAAGVVDYVTDAWGVPLYYYRPGAPGRNSDSYDLFSAGPNQKTSTKVWDKDKNVIYDYSAVANAPTWFKKGTGLVVADGATGGAIDGTGLLVDPATGTFDDIWDDVHNWRFQKNSGI